jgi:hypothetical protein
MAKFKSFFSADHKEADAAHETQPAPSDNTETVKEFFGRLASDHAAAPVAAPQDTGNHIFDDFANRFNLKAPGQNAAVEAAAPTQAPAQATAMFKSDLSQTDLVPGHWYHKRGADFDISEEEWMKLSADEQKTFDAVKTEADVQAVSENKEVPVVAETVKTEVTQPNAPPAKPEEPRPDFKSDLSHEELVPGKWYHKRGMDYDITATEWRRLPAEKRRQFDAVVTDEDVQRIVDDKNKRRSTVFAATPRALTPRKMEANSPSTTTTRTTRASASDGAGAWSKRNLLKLASQRANKPRAIQP